MVFGRRRTLFAQLTAYGKLLKLFVAIFLCCVLTVMHGMEWGLMDVTDDTRYAVETEDLHKNTWRRWVVGSVNFSPFVHKVVSGG